MPDNNFTGHARIYVRYAYISRTTDGSDGKESPKINGSSAKFSARFHVEDATNRHSVRDEYQVLFYFSYIFV